METKTPTARNGTKKRAILIGCAVLIVLLIAACFIYIEDYYHAEDAAIEVLRSLASTVTIVEHRNDRITLIPDDPVAGLIFYPGGKVQFEAYAPLMEACAEQGILCVLLHMPGNLAVLDRNAAAGVAAEYPQVTDWYIGGHSLGGDMAAAYVAEHTEEYAGLVLLASYTTNDLTESGLQALSVYGTEDGVLNRERYASSLENLPSDLTGIVIDGGCHAYFGCFGAQYGDGIPSSSNTVQIGQTADAIAAMAVGSGAVLEG